MLRKTKQKTWIFPLSGLVLGGMFLALVWSLFQPVSQLPANSVRFVIPRGQAISVIASRLVEEDLIKNEYAFRAVLKLKGYESKLQAGSFRLSPDMSPDEIAYELTQGTNDLWITIPEGWRREEIAESLVEQEMPAFDPDEFLTLTTDLEGQLFPDSYLFSRESTAATVTQILHNTFEQKVVTGLADEISASSRDFNQALIMASIVEREARGYEEMRQVAGILWNRIDIGMGLQADATLQYVTGYDQVENSWWTPPTAADKELISTYNTYKYAGLPPAPIANPGISAIRAALNPATTDNLYYLHDPSGEIHYARSLEQHNANVQQYLR